MNKLEELHKNIAQKEYNNSFDEGGHTDFLDAEKIGKQSAEITTDVAVKFADWIDRNQYIKFAIYENQINQTTYKYSKWDKSYKEPYEILEAETKTTQELFEIFINNHYESNT